VKDERKSHHARGGRFSAIGDLKNGSIFDLIRTIITVFAISNALPAKN
jgi:hypothetical protein